MTKLSNYSTGRFKILSKNLASHLFLRFFSSFIQICHRQSGTGNCWQVFRLAHVPRVVLVVGRTVSDLDAIENDGNPSDNSSCWCHRSTVGCERAERRFAPVCGAGRTCVCRRYVGVVVARDAGSGASREERRNRKGEWNWDGIRGWNQDVVIYVSSNQIVLVHGRGQWRSEEKRTVLSGSILEQAFVYWQLWAKTYY